MGSSSCSRTDNTRKSQTEEVDTCITIVAATFLYIHHLCLTQTLWWCQKWAQPFVFFLLHFTQSIHCSGCIVLSCRHTASPPDILRHQRAWHQAGDLSVPVGRTHACPKHLGAEPHSLLLSHRQLIAVLSQGEKRTEKPRSPSSETQTLLFSSWQFLSGISMHHAQRCS